MNCPICKRELPPGKHINDHHHLIPKIFKGTERITIHRICHRKLHSVLTEREMLHYYYTIERLLEHEEIKKFVKWVSKKKPSYYSGSKDTINRKNKRRR